MGKKICVDSDVLIDFLNSHEDAVSFVKKHEKNTRLQTTSVNIFEVACGAYNSTKKGRVATVTELIDRLEILPFDEFAALKASQILVSLRKSGKIIEFRDVFIAAIALVNACSLKTNNKKYFASIEELDVL